MALPFSLRGSMSPFRYPGPKNIREQWVSTGLSVPGVTSLAALASLRILAWLEQQMHLPVPPNALLRHD